MGLHMQGPQDPCGPHICPMNLTLWDTANMKAGTGITKQFMFITFWLFKKIIETLYGDFLARDIHVIRDLL